MIAPAAHNQSTTLNRATQTLAIVFGLLCVLGMFWGASLEQVIAYLLVLSAAVLPSLLWLRMGALGIPILPAVGLAYIPYFAWPLLSGGENTQAYTLWEIARAGITVALFLVTATVAWRLIAGTVRARHAIATEQADPSRAVGFMLAGLLVGVVFHAGVILGWLEGIGTLFGLVRSIAVTFVTVACFLIGVTRAQGVLRGPAWAASLAGLGLLTALSWSSLFLVGGMIYLLAAGLGFVLVSKRIPVLAFGVLFVVVAVLHAGKGEMRERYWISGSNSADISAMQVPGLLVDWVGVGIHAISTGELGQSVVDRASLIQMILRAQVETPDRVDFLMGETYALLPSILVPRFIDSDKPASQVGMDLLNIRYGVLTVEGVASTAIGWGLIAEAYANFGYYGVIGIALALGVFCGALFIWSARADIVSIPTLASIAAMMGLINLEADFIQLFSSLLQSFVAVLVFSALYRWFAIPRDSVVRAGRNTSRDSSAGW